MKMAIKMTDNVASGVFIMNCPHIQFVVHEFRSFSRDQQGRGWAGGTMQILQGRNFLRQLTESVEPGIFT